MAVELFTVIITSMISAPIGVVTQRLLDTMVKCVCGKQKNGKSRNEALNPYRCDACANALDQYVAVTPHTVNPNASLISAHVSNIDHNRHWFFGTKPNELVFDLDIANACDQQVIVEVVVGEFRGKALTQDQVVFKSRGERVRFKESVIRLPTRRFPQKICTLTYDFRVTTVYDDLIYKARYVSRWGE